MGGAREGGWLFWNERPVPVDYDRHAVDRYLQLAEHLNCRISAWKGRIPFTKAHDPGIDDLLDGGQNSGRPLVAVNPMAGWKTKLWEPLKFAALSDRLQEELSCRVVFTGSRSDRPSIEQILGAMRKPAANLAGQTSLKELAYLYSRCTALVTTDTGPMHIAAAMGCRVVALFGPTAPWRTGPYGEGHSVIRSNVECSPCFKKRCREPSCMKEITTEAVFRTVQGVLTENR
jgi:3-deoxy-D-manno-octulosonic-acid transferase/heptosyltransferase-1